MDIAAPIQNSVEELVDLYSLQREIEFYDDIGLMPGFQIVVNKLKKQRISDLV